MVLINVVHHRRGQASDTDRHPEPEYNHGPEECVRVENNLQESCWLVSDTVVVRFRSQRPHPRK
jgi:hypothetical protein